jgi:hypothetical protein
VFEKKIDSSHKKNQTNMFGSKTIHRKIMWSQFPPNLSCLQNNPPENNVEPLSSISELPINNLPENNVEPVPVKSAKQSAGK